MTTGLYKKGMVLGIIMLFLGAGVLPQIVPNMKTPVVKADDLDDGLVGYWSFDDGTGSTTATDESDYHNDGTLINMDTSTCWVDGVSGYALDLDGIDDYVNVGNDASLTDITPSASTISAWIYNEKTITPGINDLRTIVGQRAYHQHNGYGMQYGYCVDMGVYDYIISDVFFGGYCGCYFEEIPAGQWIHVVGVFGNDVSTIYINGEAKPTTQIDYFSGYIPSNEDVMIGREGNWGYRYDYHNGLIDEVRIYNRALSESEIQTLYNQDSQNQGLVGYWSFDEGSGNTVYDGSGYDNDGTIYGASWTTDNISGNALSFDGVDDYVEIPFVDDFVFNDESVTFSAWVQIVDNAVDYRTFIYLGDADNNDNRPYFFMGKSRSGYLDGRIFMNVVPVDLTGYIAVSDQDGGALPKDTWMHVVGVVNYEQLTIQLYINGNLDDSVSLGSYDLGAANQLKLRFGMPAFTTSDLQHKGLLDEIRIYNRALSETEIQDIYNQGGVNQPPTCVIELQKNGLPINAINVGEFFDICITDFSGDIQQIRFLSDEEQNGIVDPGFTWTDWYDWDTSTSDWTGIWDTDQKIKTWAFATPGMKEVWAEVKDNLDRTSRCSANIYANQPSTGFWVEVDNQVGAYICNDFTSYAFTRNLKKGNRGDDVKYLQILLNSNPTTRIANEGFGSPCHETAYFGELTKTAVIEFQRLHGLLKTGEIDDNTRAELNSMLATIKHIPNGWILKVINTHNNEQICGGSIWWEVVDETDEISGWIAYKKTTSETKYLKEISENLGIQMTEEISNVNDRKNVIVNLVKNRDSYFSELSSFPAELILAIIAGEMPSDVDNEFISFDCGRGISQITNNNLVGKYSGVKCYSGTHKGYMPYEFVYPFDKSITQDYWTNRNCELGSYLDETTYRDCECKTEQECEGEESWYYGGTDTSGRCKYYKSADCGCRVYTNSIQGFEANIKDGKGALKDFYIDSLDKNDNTESNFKFKSTLKNGDIGKEVAILRYILKSEIDENLPITCYFGSLTEAALKKLQKNMFPDEEPTGILDKETRSKLNEFLDNSYSDLRNKLEIIKSWVGATWRYNHGNPKGTIKSDIRNYLSGIAYRLVNLNSYFDNYQIELGTDILDERDKQLLLIIMRNYIFFEIKSPIELRIYDDEGNVTGVINGQLMEDIQNSIYDVENEVAVIFFPYEGYIYEVKGTEAGLYGLEGGLIKDGEVINFIAVDIPINTNDIHRYIIDWQTLYQEGEGVAIQIDADNDGIFERAITSDDELTQDEFILQTETTINIDPDTLNLNSNGKWITSYIELPEGYNVTGINVSTILLNNTVPAEDHPTNISDYDEDGIGDLMVKFDRQDVIGILESGDNVEITVAGELIDGTRFEGTDYIKVI